MLPRYSSGRHCVATRRQRRARAVALGSRWGGGSGRARTRGCCHDASLALRFASLSSDVARTLAETLSATQVDLSCQKRQAGPCNSDSVPIIPYRRGAKYYRLKSLSMNYDRRIRPAHTPVGAVNGLVDPRPTTRVNHGSTRRSRCMLGMYLSWHAAASALRTKSDCSLQKNCSECVTAPPRNHRSLRLRIPAGRASHAWLSHAPRATTEANTLRCIAEVPVFVNYLSFFDGTGSAAPGYYHPSTTSASSAASRPLGHHRAAPGWVQQTARSGN
jgi:hypothetical protein